VNAVIITKPSVCGQGLNWQHADRMAFVGRSFSYESWYQAVRRCWRFGQTKPVHVHLIVSEGEDQIGRVIDRKAEDHATMKQAMRDASRRNMGKSSEVKVPYNPTHNGRLPSWLSAA
jgi:SNF2 family DNA or RNA helicase